MALPASGPAEEPADHFQPGRRGDRQGRSLHVL